MVDVGCVFRFEVDPGDDEVTADAMRATFDAMGAEEFPSGEVRTYTAYQDGSRPGRWFMFELFSEHGSRVHASGPLVRSAGAEMMSRLTGPYGRTLLEPVLFAGCGGPIEQIVDQVQPW
jgi:hypothetical protein